jgi:hypothetical protein
VFRDGWSVFPLRWKLFQVQGSYHPAFCPALMGRGYIHVACGVGFISKGGQVNGFILEDLPAPDPPLLICISLNNPFDFPASCVLRPASCVLRPASCVLRPASCVLRPASCVLRPASCVLQRHNGDVVSSSPALTISFCFRLSPITIMVRREARINYEQKEITL